MAPDDHDPDHGYDESFVVVFRRQLEEAVPGDPMPPMDFEAQLRTLGERLTTVSKLIEQHRREMEPTGIPSPMLDMTSWNLYQTAFSMALHDL